ncbi:hypothetical protein HPG69_000679 [Diceros bicornis minor]|uniref:Uncharacterized protein n=1 Tax=Diceros bicornis minor TaxID=77932 RepID=A0A7J7FI91_DICBM|nr:hypothetical protein HPG69_000679 [Diceros bicornis minor]
MQQVPILSTETYLGPVLNSLRHRKLVINKVLAEEGVLEEAEFYITSWIKVVKDKIRERDRKTSRVSVKHPYGVLQCREEALARPVSTTTDAGSLSGRPAPALPTAAG